jgi:hypothetical protein
MSAADVSAGAAVASVLVTLGALEFARRQLGEGRRNTQRQIDDAQARERRTRVDQYLARLTDVDFRPLVADAVELFDTPPAERDAAWATWSTSDPKKRLETLAFLNFFEELAASTAPTCSTRRPPSASSSRRRCAVGTAAGGSSGACRPCSAFSEWQAMVDEARVAELIGGGGGGEAAP